MSGLSQPIPVLRHRTNATLALVEALPHSDLAQEDMPIRHSVDLLMMAFVDGKERSQVSRTLEPSPSQIS